VIRLVCLAIFGATLVAGRTSLEVPLVKQESRQTCLVACAAMLMRYQGTQVDHLSLWRSVKMWNDGTSFFQVESAAHARGLGAATFSANEAQLARLLELGLPTAVAVQQEGKHCLVVAGHDPKAGTFTVLDPSTGQQTLRIEALAKLRAPWAQQTLVVGNDWLERARAGGLPAAAWAEQDAQYRKDAARRE
jgi:ABC-type bacteriocin/lantibiotic exporter with double-glycine peptidase domain